MVKGNRERLLLWGSDIRSHREVSELVGNLCLVEMLLLKGAPSRERSQERIAQSNPQVTLLLSSQRKVG